MQQFAYSRTEQGIRDRQRAALALVPQQPPSPTHEDIKHMIDVQVQREVQSHVARLMTEVNRALLALDEKWEIQLGAINKEKEWKRVTRPMSVVEVVRRICRVSGLSMEELTGRRNTVEVTFWRQAVYYWAMRRTGFSSSQIGRKLRRDHSTVLFGTSAYVKKRAEQGRTLRALR